MGEEIAEVPPPRCWCGDDVRYKGLCRRHYDLEYNKRLEVKAKRKEYRQSIRGKELAREQQRRYNKLPANKEKRREYNRHWRAKPGVKEHMAAYYREYYNRPESVILENRRITKKLVKTLLERGYSKELIVKVAVNKEVAIDLLYRGGLCNE